MNREYLSIPQVARLFPRERLAKRGGRVAEVFLLIYSTIVLTILSRECLEQLSRFPFESFSNFYSRRLIPVSNLILEFPRLGTPRREMAERERASKLENRKLLRDVRSSLGDLNSSPSSRDGSFFSSSNSNVHRVLKCRKRERE